ncbi:sphingosine-1-phosphate phosphatase 1-like [Scleropages formosus]|uniref:Sphingosine-1-phosphate phosphatase 1 n=1 Tax=Scleropages formosus TaxID=113540 RepID=A0A0P7UCK2_SCLFO|nr:sphingosine-1-phosphate phosphatase 1 [Scleropages formosus]KPP71814.1 sphingosine-1-phosphate phosphatase 1-like [Scleropages formosus]
MASGLKSRFARLCEHLKDPHHVARFQQMCGVKGSFLRNRCGGGEPPSCRGDGENGAVTGSSDVERRLRTGPGSRAKQEGRCQNGVRNGTAGTCGAGETETETDPAPGSPLKPRRRNSLTGDVGQEFLIENKLLYYLFSFGTELGNELFYITFFPFFIWNVDPFVGRRIILVWVWVMYLGQCTKDLVGWSRPASPPVVKLEVFYNSEYSMPSTHAMSGTAIPFSLFLLTYGRWQYPMMMGVVMALSWCVLVCISRIYMGMHSILDVIAGFLYSVLILVLFHPALDMVDTFNQTCCYAPLAIISMHLVLALFSFTLDTWSTSRGDTAQILGTGAGIALGFHLNRRLGLLPDPPLWQLPFTPPMIDTALLAKSLLRLLLGLMVLLLIRAVMKVLTIPLVCRVSGVCSDDVRTARQHMEVELPYRYIVYGTVGFSCSFLAPLLFSYIGLS